MSSSKLHDSAPGGAMTDPVRYPVSASPHVRTKRAFVLVLLTLLVPGSAQIVAGDRRLGRAALAVTLSFWAVLALTLLLLLLNRPLLINIITNPFASLAIVILLVALAVGWAALFINTLRLIRPVLLEPSVRPAVGFALVLALVLGSGSLGYAAYLLNVGRNAIGNIFSAGPAIDPVDGRYNFLMMGGDAGEDRTGRRPDSLSVLSVDAETGQTAIISVPRNFQNAQFSKDSPMREIYPDGYNCGDECLINAINTEVTNQHADLYPGVADPGAQATMEAVSGTLGMTIQAYVLVDMEGFATLIDAMGGIKIKAGGCVPMSGYFDDYSQTHGMPLGWIPAGEQTLDGNQALWYGRSREYVDDYARIQRQQLVHALVDLVEVRDGGEGGVEVRGADRKPLDVLALRLDREVQEAAKLGGGNVGFHNLGARVGDVLELGQQRGRVQLLQHGLLDALLALDAGVVIYILA